jgi:hypothetical protein
MHQRATRTHLQELPVVVDQLRVHPVYARLAGLDYYAIRKAWLGRKIAANRIDLAHRAAIAAIFHNHRQVAGAQQLLAGGLPIFAQINTKG